MSYDECTVEDLCEECGCYPEDCDCVSDDCPDCGSHGMECSCYDDMDDFMVDDDGDDFCNIDDEDDNYYNMRIDYESYND